LADFGQALARVGGLVVLEPELVQARVQALGRVQALEPELALVG